MVGGKYLFEVSTDIHLRPSGSLEAASITNRDEPGQKQTGMREALLYIFIIPCFGSMWAMLLFVPSCMLSGTISSMYRYT